MSKQISGCLPGVWSERYSSRPRRRSHSLVVLFFIGVQFELFGTQKVQKSILGKGFSQDILGKVQIGRRGNLPWWHNIFHIKNGHSGICRNQDIKT